MFTGLIVETGECIAIQQIGESARLELRAPRVGPSSGVGDSIAVNGCCLTVTQRSDDRLTFDLLAETLRRTSLAQLKPGRRVNLEPALSAGAKLGGHFVQGHVDTTSEIVEFSRHGEDHRLEIKLPAEFAGYVAYKGSVAVDGISLTVAEVTSTTFVCWIIPHTLTVTNLAERSPGEILNLEFDILAKYVERIISIRNSQQSNA